MGMRKGYTYECWIKYIGNCKINMRVVVFLLLAILIAARPDTDISGLPYTEDIDQYKRDNQRGRMEILLGCWLMSREYSDNDSQAYQLQLIKKCMRRITRKDSVVKITSLIGKNMTTPKRYQDIVSPLEIAGITLQQESEFDRMLLGYIRGYEKDLSGMKKGNEGDELKKKMDEELQKRQKYYFGFIPANKFSTIMIVITVTIFMIFLCSCWKYYSKKSKKQEESHQFCSGHNHNHTQKKAAPKAQKPKRY